MRLALIVSSTPYRRRAARSELDVALAAAALDYRLEVFFLGSALLHLAEDREPAPAGLTPGLRAWAALDELGEVRLFADRKWVNQLESRVNGLAWVSDVEALEEQDLVSRWRSCDRVMVL